MIFLLLATGMKGIRAIMTIVTVWSWIQNFGMIFGAGIIGKLFVNIIEKLNKGSS